MKTIVRNERNELIVVDTVYRTVINLAKTPGYIKIETIQNAINRQLEDEFVSRKIVVRALATILDRKRK